jgi:hypothetical protein
MKWLSEAKTEKDRFYVSEEQMDMAVGAIVISIFE